MNKGSRVWDEIKSRGERVGHVFFILGCSVLLVQFVLVLNGLRTETGLLGASLGLLSVGLGFIAIGTAAKSDKIHTDLLRRVDNNVLKVLDKFEPELDTYEPPEQIIIPEPAQLKVEGGVPRVIKGSKDEAQERLDEDTKRVGYQRGEVFKQKDGKWGVAWGGKYPL